MQYELFIGLTLAFHFTLSEFPNTHTIHPTISYVFSVRHMKVFSVLQEYHHITGTVKTQRQPGKKLISKIKLNVNE